MELKRVIYKKITCWLMTALLIAPAVMINLHILFHHKHHKERHDNYKITTLDNEISMCKCCDLTYTFFTPILTKTSYKAYHFLFKTVDVNSIEDIYFNLFLKYKKGRSPPKIV